MLPISLLFIFGSLLSCRADTMLLPLQNGVLRTQEMQQVDVDIPFNIAILPADNYEVRSCSNGKVASIFCNKDRQVVFIRDSQLVYGYVLDTPLVKAGQSLKKGEMIGTLKSARSDTTNLFPLIFLVLKNGEFTDPERFIVYKKTVTQ
jgi:hypothetical protein